MDLAVLVPLGSDGPPGPPESTPMGRAALALAGVGVVFATHARDGVALGHAARPGRWEPASVRVAAAYDRFPSKGRAEAHTALIAGLGGVPIANPPALARLCRDKLECQRHLEAHGLPLPAVESDPARFTERLREWGAAFLKPRYGAFGVGVRRVSAGDPLPDVIVGDSGDAEPAILQRAVEPPAGWAGVSVRLLVQRDEQGRWVVAPGVARRDRVDPVVNVARGAEVVTADALEPWTIAAAEATAVAAARALADHPDGTWLAEVGIDFAIAADGRPWLLEVNHRPRGRLEVLAAADPRYAQAHLDACARPLRFLAARVGRG